MPRQKAAYLDDTASVGRRLHEARARAGLTIRQLSFPGCSPAYISLLESGRRTPSLQVLVELARRLQMPVECLAWGSDGGPAPPADESAFALHLYEDVAKSAPTLLQRLWALGGILQIAALRGDVDVARDAIARECALQRMNREA